MHGTILVDFVFALLVFPFFCPFRLAFRECSVLAGGGDEQKEERSAIDLARASRPFRLPFYCTASTCTYKGQD